MSTPSPTTNESILQETPDFSLVLGGPLYQLWRRSRLAGDTLDLLHRRIVILAPTHPDRCGGASFLASVCQAFVPVLLAQGVVVAGTIADKIFFVGAKLPAFKLEIIGLVAVMLFAILGPSNPTPNRNGTP